MSNLYNRIEALCQKASITITTMCKESGASRASLSDLKVGRKQSLSAETLSKIAGYFGVSVDYLLGNEQKENAPALTEKDRRDVALDVERIMENLAGSGGLMFDGVPMSEEARASMAAAMRIGLEEARRRNKETYTPRKYRKE